MHGTEEREVHMKQVEKKSQTQSLKDMIQNQEQLLAENHFCPANNTDNQDNL